MTPETRLKRARRKLASAKLLLADNDPGSACNRAYYAMFEAALAVLSTLEAGPAEGKTHSGLIQAFGKYLIKPGLLPTDIGKALIQVQRMRVIADYTGDEIEPDKAQWAIEQAINFVDVMSKNLNLRQPSKPPETASSKDEATGTEAPPPEANNALPTPPGDTVSPSESMPQS